MKLYTLLIPIIIFCLTSCDPAHIGETFVRNESSYSLKVNYTTHHEDTSIIVPPNTSVNIFHIGGIGSGKEYNCCSCEFLTITAQPTDTSATLTKDITDSQNWILVNPNKRRFSHKEINCEFVITQSDIH